MGEYGESVLEVSSCLSLPFSPQLPLDALSLNEATSGFLARPGGSSRKMLRNWYR